MKSRLLVSLSAVGSILLVGAALAQDAAKPKLPPGYLAADAEPDTLKIMPPPPKSGSPGEAADRAVFDKTRALAGSPRWSLATQDANLAQGPDMFSCAVGVKLDPATVPALTHVFRRVLADTLAVTEPAKDHYARPRPYTLPGATTAPVCVPKSDQLTKNPSYPSGHSTISWTWGLILAEVAPDRATQILARARSIGDSRVVCGVHYLSDIDAGRTAGASLVAALNGDAAFRADLEKARAEMAALRAGQHAAPADCSVQDAAAEHAPY